MTTSSVSGPCREILHWGDPAPPSPGTPTYCQAPGEGVQVAPVHPLRSPVFAGPYCLAHGGRARAEEEALQDWMVRAPYLVGDAGSVLDAGVAGLASEHNYVVVRALEGGWWTTGLGIGSHYRDLLGVWASQADALAYGAQVRRRELELRMAELLRLRGGDLTWGLPVRPLATPLVVVLGRTGNAMDAAGAGEAKPAPADLPPVVEPADLVEEIVQYPGQIRVRSASGLVTHWVREEDGAWVRRDADRRVWPAPSQRARSKLKFARRDPAYTYTVDLRTR